MRVHSPIRRTLASTVTTLLILTAQLFFAAVGAVADAQEPTSFQVHLHKPHQEHVAHNPDTCALCMAIHAGVLPAAALKVPLSSAVAWDECTPEPSQTHSQSHQSHQLARAPPASV